ncbi:MAG: DPP IV N-terminal domain-containing protein, partial [Arenimonas sp.]
MSLRTTVFTALLLAPLTAIAQTPLTLDQAMADPDWIGPPVEQAWWAWDGSRVQYVVKRTGSVVRDTYTQPVAGGGAQLVGDAALPQLDANFPVYDRTHKQALFVRNGDVFLRDLRTGTLRQLTRSAAAEADPQFASDQRAVQFRVGNDWFRWSPTEAAATQVAMPRAEKDPATDPASAPLRDQALRLSQALRKEEAQRKQAREAEDARRRADPTRAARPAYLGDGVEITATSLSPDGRWLLVVASAKGTEAGRGGKMPKYVTATGYEEMEDVRTRVGLNAPVAQALHLVDLASGQVRELSLASLPGAGTDPLADLRAAQKLPVAKPPRVIRIVDGDSLANDVQWSKDGARAAVRLRAVDNKDRWIARLELAGASLASAGLESAHRLTDPAWINWNFNEFGWLADDRSLWLLSEQDGYSHLYTQARGGSPRALTQGNWETSAPVLAPDGSFYFVCNREWPGDYEVCAVPPGGGAVREVSGLDGVEDFALSPDGQRLLVRYSGSYLPAQIAVQPVSGGSATVLTDTRTAQYKARTWIEPQYVQVPSTHGAGTVWAKLYRPATLEPGRKYPVVLFVHGAGYTQNVHERYPYYFREQMFHHRLVEQGYVVLDMDYRASEGYGRDWRTAIYRRMGRPELEDLIDGVNWMVAKQQGDA